VPCAQPNGSREKQVFTSFAMSGVSFSATALRAANPGSGLF
jgi:hypothetical protein